MISTENLQPRGPTRLTRSISPSWPSWVMELHLLQEPEPEEETEAETETEVELEEPLGSPGRTLVMADRRCQLRPPLEVTGAAGVETEVETEVEVSKHPQPNL